MNKPFTILLRESEHAKLVEIGSATQTRIEALCIGFLVRLCFAGPDTYEGQDPEALQTVIIGIRAGFSHPGIELVLTSTPKPPLLHDEPKEPIREVTAMLTEQLHELLCTLAGINEETPQEMARMAVVVGTRQIANDMPKYLETRRYLNEQRAIRN